jgi:signal transduction histidine kinase
MVLLSTICQAVNAVTSAPSRPLKTGLVCLLFVVLITVLDVQHRTAWADLAPPVNISAPTSDDILFTGHIASFQDPEQSKTLNDIRALPDSAFTAHSNIPAFGYTNNAIWYRIDLIASRPIGESRYLDIGPIFLNEINVYLTQKDTSAPLWSVLLGDHLPSSQRPVLAPEHLATFPAIDKGKYSLYIRTQSNSTQFIEASLLSNDVQISRWSLGLVAKGLFIGVVMMMAIIYVVVGIFIRDYAVALYGVCLAAFGTLASAVGGVFLTIFAPEWPYTSDLLVGAGTAINISAASLLWVHILDIGSECRLCKKIFCAYSVVVLLGAVTATSPLYTIFASYCQFSHTAIMLIYIGFLIRRIIRNPRFIVHWIYLTVMAVPTVALMIYYLALNHLLPVNNFTEAAYPFALLAHLVLMSALMGLRITAIDRDRIKAATMAESTENLVQEQRKLVSMLSHEFRTPLAVIQRAAEMVTLRLHKEAAANGTYDVPRPVTDRLKRIQDQSGKLARLVDVFLGKDNLNAPQFALARKLIPAKGFLGEFTAMAQRENAQIGLRYSGKANSVLYADETLLSLALTNVIENARRQLPGETISLVAEEEHKMTLKIDISHPGLVLDEAADIEALRNSLFSFHSPIEPETDPNRFYEKKTDPESLLPRNEIGLGLHITQRIIAAHGGKTDIVTNAETGFNIRITLPLESPL